MISLDVDKIGFTGSTPVGHMIQKFAAESNLKRVTLELGGKSPVVVCDDCDLDTAVNTCHVGLFLNMGQCCVAGTRIFVQDTIYDKFVEKAVAKAKAVKIGAYDQPGVEQGPQIDDIQFKRIMGFIDKGKAEGATVATGGKRHGDKGYFIEPTVFTGESSANQHNR